MLENDTDRHSPILHAKEYQEPVTLPYPVNTSGAEDSPFILPDGKTLYFFFTPDVRVPVEKQILDEVTGIYDTHKTADGWSKPERVWLRSLGNWPWTALPLSGAGKCGFEYYAFA